MFGSLFKKKPKGPESDYVNYLSKPLKYKQVTLKLQELDNNQITLLSYFFDQTGVEIRQLCQAANVPYHEPGKSEKLSTGLNLVKVYDLSTPHLNAEQVISMEVHPIYSINRKLIDFFKDTTVEKVVFYLGLDEPLIKLFGADRIIELLKRMGTNDDEPRSHTMIDKSIERAQQKLENHQFDHVDITSSQEDWMEANQKLLNG